MRKTLKWILLSLCLFYVATGYSQTIVKGKVINERGEAVEYVSIGLKEDSVNTISDVSGNFKITVPQGRTNNLLFSHVSYQTADVKRDKYANGKELTVVLKDKVVKLAEVVIDRNNEPKKIVGKGVSALTEIGLRGRGREDGKELGSAFKSKRDCVISDIILGFTTCTYNECTLSFNIYRVEGKKFTNILNKPLYYKVTQDNRNKKIHITPDEDIVLKRKERYCIAVSVVDSDKDGMICFHAAFRRGYIRKISTGKRRKIPAAPAIIVRGTEIK